MRRAWAARMVIPLAVAVAVSTAPVATAAVGDPPAPRALTAAESLSFHRAVFPLTITRTGGFAGFQDVLVVAGQGRVSLTRRGQLVRQCQLRLVVVNRVRTAASQVPWARIPRGDSRPRFPDDLVDLVRSPLGGPFRLTERRLGAAGKVLQELLTELTVVSGGPTASRMCKAV
jgi:hypothetical protein